MRLIKGFLNSYEEQAVIELKGIIKNSLGDRLKEVILYGSKARGNFSDLSDIDLLIIVDALGADDFDIISETAYEMELKYNLEISVSPYSWEYYNEHLNNNLNLFIQNIKIEGVAV